LKHLQINKNKKNKKKKKEEKVGQHHNTLRVIAKSSIQLATSRSKELSASKALKLPVKSSIHWFYVNYIETWTTDLHVPQINSKVISRNKGLTIIAERL